MRVGERHSMGWGWAGEPYLSFRRQLPLPLLQWNFTVRLQGKIILPFPLPVKSVCVLFAVCKKWISNILRTETPILTPPALKGEFDPSVNHNKTSAYTCDPWQTCLLGAFSNLLRCSLRQKSFPLCTCDMEIGTAHSGITADAHTGPGEAGILTKTAFLKATNPGR